MLARPYNALMGRRACPCYWTTIRFGIASIEIVYSEVDRGGFAPVGQNLSALRGDQKANSRL